MNIGSLQGQKPRQTIKRLPIPMDCQGSLNLAPSGGPGSKVHQP